MPVEVHTLTQLKSLIIKGEGEEVDFKQTISQPYKIAKTISAFANSKGGVLLVGVKDDKTISGVDPEEEKYLLETASDFYCDPPIHLTYQEVEDDEEDKTVLVVRVKESNDKPHFIRDKNNKLHAYIRQNDKSVPAGKTMLDLMKKGQLASQNTNGKTMSIPLTSFNERKLRAYLTKHERITLKQFMHIVNISRRRASRILTDLTLNGTLRLHEHEKEDYYTL
jgi:predicted HTH transcriptional regulator